MAKSKKWMKNTGKKAKGKADDKAMTAAKAVATTEKKPRGERWYGKKS